MNTRLISTILALLMITSTIFTKKVNLGNMISLDIGAVSNIIEIFRARNELIQEDPVVFSYFDGTDTDGWTINFGTLENPGEGGSGGGENNGFLYTSGPADGHTSYFIAPPKYHGDWTWYTELSIDLWSSGGTYYTSGYYMYGDIYIANGEMSAQLLLPRRPATTWDQFVIFLTDAESWTFEGGATKIQDVLGNVTDFHIRAEYGNGEDYAGLDNVVLLASESFSIRGRVIDKEQNPLSGIKINVSNSSVVI